MMRSIFLVHATVSGVTAESVDLVMQDAVVTNVNSAVIWHLPVLNEEDVALLRLFAMGKTDEIFIAIIQVENVVVAQIPRRDMQVSVGVDLDIEFAFQIVSTQHPAVEDAKDIRSAGVRHFKAIGRDHFHLA